MRLSIDQKTAESHKEYKIIVDSLNKKGVHENDIKWEYDWCVVASISSDPFCFNAPVEQKRKTLQERLDTLLPNIRCYLLGSYKRKRNSEIIKEIPQVIIDSYSKEYENAIKEEDAFDALSPEEKNKSIENLLKQLRGKPGFIEIYR